MKNYPGIDLMIVGAQKAGTTSLKNYLLEHPDVRSHPQMEHTYFVEQEEYDRGYDAAFPGYFGKEMPKTGQSVVAKHAGLYVYEPGLQKLAEHRPDCKIVLLVRHPTRRAYSSYTMERSNGWLKNDFTDLKEGIRKHEQGEYDIMYKFFIKWGLYAESLRLIYQYFPKEQVRIIRFSDLKSQPVQVCQEMFDWLGVAKDFVPDTNKVHNPTRQVKSGQVSSLLAKIRQNNNPIKRLAKAVLPASTFQSVGNRILDMNRSDQPYEPISDEMKELLIEYFRPHNADLEELTGMDFSDWNQ